MSLQSVERVVRDHVGPQECAPGTAPVRVGDIWRVEAMPGWETEPRTAVVLRVHSGPVDFAQILLAHTCVEMATTDDAILEMESLMESAPHVYSAFNPDGPGGPVAGLVRAARHQLAIPNLTN